ncbi:MAG: molybdate ABC transporter substrate-binding protein [Syntrophales bacterium]|nr:molybdate ABC transporter substrate-binding protein [Syntrophales bacterium]
MRKIIQITISLLLLTLVIPFSVAAQDKITVAVAGNFISAFKEIAADFEKQSGIVVQATFASTGSLYSQIINGAPYDLFLSADEKRPGLLREEGLAYEPFVYARGRAILWSSNQSFCASEDWKGALAVSTGRISLANPVTAPYGTVALDAVRKAGFESALESRFVTAQTVAQSFQYASTGAVEAGFCALSAVASEEGQKGCYYHIPEAEPVIQAACIIAKTKNRKTVEQFAAFLVSGEALEIKKTFGYE